MNNLYKRIVTMGMISFSALLAWLYCIIAYKDKIIYVICLSLLLVISLYALFNAIIKLRLKKDEEMYKYISDTITSTVSSMAPNNDNAREAERIAKATYVQLRKANTGISSLTEASNTNTVKSIDNYTALNLSMKETVTKAMTNSAKLVVKYNKQDNQNVMDMLREFTANMDNISQSLDAINTRIDNMNLVAERRPKTILEDTVLDDTLPDVLDIFSPVVEEPAEETTAEPMDPNKQLSQDEIAALFSQAAPSPAVEEPAEETTAEPMDPNKQLSQDEIAALFSQAAPSPAVEEPAEEPVDPNKQLSQDEIAALFSQAAPSPAVEEPAEEPVDPNKQLSQDEIAALFDQSVKERTAKSDEDFEHANLTEAMDQNLIDALLNNMDDGLVSVPTTAEENIIPFPATEETVSEAPPVEEPFDPNKPLSPDEIAALFASMNGSN